MLTCTAAVLIAAAAKTFPIRAMQWLKVDGGAEAMVEAINYDSGVCLAANASDNARAGAVLFRSPALLGGQASKARLSCASCHIDGGGNPYFHFPNASGEAGTADVSNSFFSAAGGNSTFDPKPIPDLSEGGKISRTVPGEMEAFLKTLIVKEFAGAEPSDNTLAALSEFIRALESCTPEQALKTEAQLNKDIRVLTKATGPAAKAALQGDRQDEQLYISAARDTLALLYERYDTPSTKAAAQDIKTLSIELGAILKRSEARQRVESYIEFASISAATLEALKVQKDRSLYNPTVLRDALKE